MATSRATKLEDWAVSKGMPRPNAGGFVRGIESLVNGLAADASSKLEAAWNVAIPEVVGALSATMSIYVDHSEVIDVLTECGYISEVLSATLRGIVAPVGVA